MLSKNKYANRNELINLKLSENIEVESFFNDFVKDFGGELVSEIIGHSTTFKNADYLFRKENVIAELKCLKKNLFEDKEYSYKFNQLTSRWIDKGLINGSQLLQWLFGREILPQKCYKDIIKLAKPQIERALHKANKQIKETKEYFNLKDAKGLVLIANDGNYAFENKHFFLLICEILQMPQFKNSVIDGYVYFTVNMTARIPDNKLDLSIWAPLYREEKTMLTDFVNDLGDKFCKYHLNFIGEPLDNHTKHENPDTMFKMKSIPKNYYKR